MWTERSDNNHPKSPQSKLYALKAFRILHVRLSLQVLMDLVSCYERTFNSKLHASKAFSILHVRLSLHLGYGRFSFDVVVLPYPKVHASKAFSILHVRHSLHLGCSWFSLDVVNVLYEPQGRVGECSICAKKSAKRAKP